MENDEAWCVFISIISIGQERIDRKPQVDSASKSKTHFYYLASKIKQNPQAQALEYSAPKIESRMLYNEQIIDSSTLHKSKLRGEIDLPVCLKVITTTS